MPDHIFSNQLLKLEHNTLPVRNWSALPSRKSVLGCLDSLFKLTVCGDGHPGDNFLRSLQAVSALSMELGHSGVCLMA